MKLIKLLPNQENFIRLTKEKRKRAYISTSFILNFEPDGFKEKTIQFVKQIDHLFDYAIERDKLTIKVDTNYLIRQIKFDTTYTDESLENIIDIQKKEMLSKPTIPVMSFNLYCFSDQKVVTLFANEVISDGYSFRILLHQYWLYFVYDKKPTLDLNGFLDFVEKENERKFSSNYQDALNTLTPYIEANPHLFLSEKVSDQSEEEIYLTPLIYEAVVTKKIKKFMEEKKSSLVFFVNNLFEKWVEAITGKSDILYKYNIHKRTKRQLIYLGNLTSAIFIKTAGDGIDTTIKNFKTFYRLQRKLYYEDIEKKFPILKNIAFNFNFLGDETDISIALDANNLFTCKITSGYIFYPQTDNIKISFIFHVNIDGRLGIYIKGRSQYMNKSHYDEILNKFKTLFDQAIQFDPD